MRRAAIELGTPIRWGGGWFLLNDCTSQRGIDGILRKLASILVLVCCIPVSALVPAEAGLAALIVLYLGYLVMELASVVENLSKLGAPVSGLKRFIENVRDSTSHDDS